MNVVYLPKLYIPHYFHGVISIYKIKYQRQNAQNIRSGEKLNSVYETCKNTAMTHGCHTYAKASYMKKATVCTYTQSDHRLPHCKCVLWYCYKCPCVHITDQETDYQYSNTTPSIWFQIYHIIKVYTTYGRIPLNNKKMCCMCKQDSDSENPQRYILEKI